MSELTQHNRQLMAGTTSFLLDCLRAGMTVANTVLCAERPMVDSERERMRYAFMAAGLAIDAIEAEARRERLGLAFAISPDVLDNLENHAKSFADYSRALEAQGDLFVHDFYTKLEARLTQYYLRGNRPRRMKPRGEGLREPQVRLRGEPTAQGGYETIARKTGQYEEARKNAKSTAELIRQSRAMEQASAEAPAETPVEAEVPAEAPVEDETPVEAETPSEAEVPSETPAAEPVAEKPAQNNRRIQDDEIWQHPTMRLPAAEYIQAYEKWQRQGGKGPPPRPSRKLRRHIQHNANANPSFKELLDVVAIQTSGP